MLAYLLADFEWANRRLELLHQQHLERAANFALEHESWTTLQSTHLEQRIRLEAKPFGARAVADLIQEHTQQIKDWRRQTAVNRRAIRLRQDQEILDLNEER